ncbi:hypothetical protein TVAG_429060 [Trichomonas vaginalis G3]|uniref:Uncharacterized protein n=1 Tax=Trichomonas vaginalis (strain ATCC PRA-98 / G3) TaxID=412133 RepID=A2GT13_TRIV3|nr:hypothetical protein TVAGG3_0465620 [Trichomonas vaginalis G3]XP_051075600.1 uncharacterized protein TVAGG3_1095340 [Trichomonas vaginalis G3]EAX75077.1 hypothetical protein TVAG_604760 [Trichomonas vaginalis G3]EAX77297.1 hypothetical protein TVAG_586750 [Trichomonas vaginalis G3]EAX79705.1 hypothetical protein TVAG_429060 [Trichomonas vaginalis G3]KAI5481997.1 hypothetical protein TVAGG3_1095340 [Trichomonas vaginalis G3]KAI5514729.1 hypothetical protein TVAGG3_0465620 [Trichomonas vagin|eukprot:XP_001288007.1 hypothetical protein [Trichomonas vaginalis G3]
MSQRLQRFFDLIAEEDEPISVGKAMRVHHNVFGEEDPFSNPEEAILTMFIMKWYEKHREVEVSYYTFLYELGKYNVKMKEYLEKRNNE